MKLQLGLVLTGLLAVVAGAEQQEKLRIGILKRVDGCTRKARSGDLVEVHYTGKLADGTVFDSSVERGQPIEFPLGVGRVIQGWDQGILGMCVGEKRKLTIPPHLGYGEHGAGGAIPPHATLIFTTELVSINGEGLPVVEVPDSQVPDLDSDSPTEDEADSDAETDDIAVSSEPESDDSDASSDSDSVADSDSDTDATDLDDDTPVIREKVDL
ncbi:peptidylprolyl isomerase family protein FPR2 [Sugiyamaella lignohabitans]|uniref:peptidylprolyl isomerase n=1 Tax=Sugiyamaella lignohabitans TaxID=796027 RepID=A0A167DR36_9ASCO|nr:peptidylprolyl isomerase family protein FPR2 [Sugiyamaella lignohabitans]ANB13192.1 peptidylprolyl isomerase family protein FPR2 [Sugiyamaella lignohabitans]